MKIRLISLSILFLLSISCNKEDSIDKISDLVFSESPFTLNGIDAKFSKDISYDIKQRTQFDIWLPNSNTPTGLVIYVHGGGFTSGDKDLSKQYRRN
jgi:acetyl esterase/lipase